jgi:hypothetical protein
MHDAASTGTNPHYLDHVVTTAASHAVAASEDIVTGNGIKLLAKGARIDAGTRERLLQHKLRKPLEDCVTVIDGVSPADFEPIAAALLQRHPLLRTLCADARARPAPASLAALALTPQMQSLLTVYAGAQPDRLEHAVGVATLALGLARTLLPGAVDRHRSLALAGLVHDIGELYIDPAYLRRGTPLTPEVWRHIVTHPLVGHRVLTSLAGAGQAVADAVLQHHERLDGFGYPRGVQGEAFTIDGQILAAAEWIMALFESGNAPMTRAGLGPRLMPGEFDTALLEALHAAGRNAPDAPVDLSTAMALELAAPRVLRLARALDGWRQARPWLESAIAAAAPALRHVLVAGLQRALRMQTSFSSTGLDARQPEPLLNELAALRDPLIYTETMSLVLELEWRVTELERGLRLRASLLAPQQGAVIDELLARVLAEPPASD